MASLLCRLTWCDRVRCLAWVMTLWPLSCAALSSWLPGRHLLLCFDFKKYSGDVKIQQTWKCLYVTTGGLSVVVFNIAFVQEVKVPTSLLSAATTVLSRSHFRNENYVLIHFQYNEFNWKSMSFQALSTVALVRSQLVQQSFRWHFKASVDISCMNFMSIWIIVGECYYWIIEFSV